MVLLKVILMVILKIIITRLPVMPLAGLLVTLLFRQCMMILSTQ